MIIHNIFYKYKLNYSDLDEKNKKKIDNLLEEIILKNILLKIKKQIKKLNLKILKLEQSH